MDTTAKVDIRKLQLLNDRIAQTIDALNQVRLSVHGLGLSHSSPVPGFGQVPLQGIPYQTPFASPIPGVAQQIYGAWPGAGLSHSTPYGYSPFQQPFQQPFGAAQVNPVVSQLLWQQGLAGGLQHSSDPWASSPYGVGHHGFGVDPISATRIMQMFPFAQMPISPVSTGY